MPLFEDILNRFTRLPHPSYPSDTPLETNTDSSSNIRGITDANLQNRGEEDTFARTAPEKKTDEEEEKEVANAKAIYSDEEEKSISIIINFLVNPKITKEEKIAEIQKFLDSKDQKISAFTLKYSVDILRLLISETREYDIISRLDEKYFSAKNTIGENILMHLLKSLREEEYRVYKEILQNSQEVALTQIKAIQTTLNKVGKALTESNQDRINSYTPDPKKAATLSNLKSSLGNIIKAQELKNTLLRRDPITEETKSEIIEWAQKNLQNSAGFTDRVKKQKNTLTLGNFLSTTFNQYLNANDKRKQTIIADIKTTQNLITVEEKISFIKTLRGNINLYTPNSVNKRALSILEKYLGNLEETRKLQQLASRKGHINQITRDKIIKWAQKNFPEDNRNFILFVRSETNIEFLKKCLSEKISQYLSESDKKEKEVLAEVKYTLDIRGIERCISLTQAVKNNIILHTPDPVKTSALRHIEDYLDNLEKTKTLCQIVLRENDINRHTLDMIKKWAHKNIPESHKFIDEVIKNLENTTTLKELLHEKIIQYLGGGDKKEAKEEVLADIERHKREYDENEASEIQNQLQEGIEILTALKNIERSSIIHKKLERIIIDFGKKNGVDLEKALSKYAESNKYSNSLIDSEKNRILLFQKLVNLIEDILKKKKAKIKEITSKKQSPEGNNQEFYRNYHLQYGHSIDTSKLVELTQVINNVTKRMKIVDISAVSQLLNSPLTAIFDLVNPELIKTLLQFIPNPCMSESTKNMSIFHRLILNASSENPIKNSMQRALINEESARHINNYLFLGSEEKIQLLIEKLSPNPEILAELLKRKNILNITPYVLANILGLCDLALSLYDLALDKTTQTNFLSEYINQNLKRIPNDLYLKVERILKEHDINLKYYHLGDPEFIESLEELIRKDISTKNYSDRQIKIALECYFLKYISDTSNAIKTDTRHVSFSITSLTPSTHSSSIARGGESSGSSSIARGGESSTHSSSIARGGESSGSSSIAIGGESSNSLHVAIGGESSNSLHVAIGGESSGSSSIARGGESSTHSSTLVNKRIIRKDSGVKRSPL